ncbi:AAA family ATPase [Cystobacter fuscus]
MPIHIQSIRPRGLLSFGPDTEAIPLRELNVIIGPNGSGKSNLIEALGLLAATPRSVGDAIRAGGGIEEWSWKGDRKGTKPSLEATIQGRLQLRYSLALDPSGPFLGWAQLEERIEHTSGAELYFGAVNGLPHLLQQGVLRGVNAHEFNPTESVLSQRQDPNIYPELFLLAGLFRSIHFYRDWTFGRAFPSRVPQPADLPNDYLMEDARNLGLMLNRIRRSPEAKQSLLSHLRLLYEGIHDFDVSVHGGTVQVFLHENTWVISASRLSDGTLRWLGLLTILLNPAPHSVVCIEEPEIGLHPDLMPSLAKLLREASERMQLVVTTHSDALVDALTSTPESVLVCEKHQGGTVMRRCEREELSEWLDKYTMGQLWRRGELGGNRW